MKPSTRQIINTVLKSDDSITEQQRYKVVDILLERPEPLRQLPLLLTQAQAATLLGISRITVWRLVKDGDLKPVCLRGAWRYRREDIERLAREGTNHEGGDISGNQGGH